MKIHYFYKRKYSQGFYDLEIVAWLEEKETSRQGIERLSFTRLERLRIFLSKSDHQARHSDISTTNKYLKGENLSVHEETKHFNGSF